MHGNFAIVQVHDGFDEGEADAKSTSLRLSRQIALLKQIKDSWQKFVMNSVAIVANLDGHVACCGFG